MNVLILSVFSSTIIFVIFKLFERFGVNTFQAIIANYFTALACGYLLYPSEWKAETFANFEWIYWSVLCSILFISLFWLMARSSQKNGVALTSVAVKMSMAFSLLLILIIYKEVITVFKISGILIAFLGIILITFQKEKTRSKTIWMLFVLFFGSGLLDFSLNYIQKFELNNISPSVFSSVSFGLAGIIGSVIILFQLILKRTKLSIKSLLFGIVLGIPNFFSIFLLMESYRVVELKDSSILAITNVSVVLLSSAFGILLFKEKITRTKAIGLVCAILAITILAIFN